MKKKYVIGGFVFISVLIFCFPVYNQTTPDPGVSETPVPTAVEEPEFPECADGNRDGFVDIIDALLIAQSYVSLEDFWDCGWGPCPDVDCSGKIDIIDALLIARYYVGLIDTLCCY